MNKLLNWLSDHLWPFSSLRRLAREHANTLSIYRDYREWSEKWHSVCKRELSSDQYKSLWDRYNWEAEQECAEIGRLHRAGRDSQVPSTEKTGEIDPKITGPVARAVVEAAKDVQEKSK